MQRVQSGPISSLSAIRRSPPAVRSMETVGDGIGGAAHPVRARHHAAAGPPLAFPRVRQAGSRRKPPRRAPRRTRGARPADRSRGDGLRQPGDQRLHGVQDGRRPRALLACSGTTVSPRLGHERHGVGGHVEPAIGAATRRWRPPDPRPCARACHAPCARRRSVSAAKPTSTGRRPPSAARMTPRSARMSLVRVSVSDSGAVALRHLLRGRGLRRVVGHRGRHDHDVRFGGARHHGFVHLGGASAPAPPAGRRARSPLVGPATSVTSAPRRSASSASAKPIRPLERLPTKRTGSMSS